MVIVNDLTVAHLKIAFFPYFKVVLVCLSVFDCQRGSPFVQNSTPSSVRGSHSGSDAGDDSQTGGKQAPWTPFQPMLPGRQSSQSSSNVYIDAMISLSGHCQMPK